MRRKRGNRRLARANKQFNKSKNVKKINTKSVQIRILFYMIRTIRNMEITSNNKVQTNYTKFTRYKFRDLITNNIILRNIYFLGTRTFCFRRLNILYYLT